MKLNDIITQLRGLEGRLFEDALYRIVWEEIEKGDLDPAAQARSIEDGDGEEGKVRAAYIRHRVRRLNDEFSSENLASEEAIRQNKESLKKNKLEQKQCAENCTLCGKKYSFFNSNHNFICRLCYVKLTRAITR